MRKLLVACIIFGSRMAIAQDLLPYRNHELPVETRVKDLLSRMTPEEKFWQMFMIPGDLDHTETPDQYRHGIFGFQVSAGSKAPGEAQQLLTYNTQEGALQLAQKINRIQKYFVEETRLGIPIIAFDESLHGLVREGATSFPQSIAMAASFDTALMGEVAAAIALETKARGIRQILSPVINIASDVRWGRVEETFGEDPFLTSAMAVAYVREFESRNIITTPKHLIANVGDGGRDSYPIHLNERFMEEIHFPPFKACFKSGGTRSVMTSYNSYDGTAATSNDWLLNKKLKGDWNFQGFVISDANATGGSVVLHNTAESYPEAARQAISSGLDVIFQTDYHHHRLFSPKLLNDSRDKASIDQAVARVLRAKFELGLFEQPYVDEKAVASLQTVGHKALARKAAARSVVLLKNAKSTLPLNKEIKTIALIGEDAVEARLGGYSGPGNGKVSVLAGLQARKNFEVRYAKGCKRMSNGWSIVPSEFLQSAGRKGLTARYFKNLSMQGEPAAMKHVDMVDFLWTISPPDPALKKHFYSARFTGTIRSPRTGKFKIGIDGNDGFRLYINGNLLVDQWIKQSHSTVLADFNFEKGKSYEIAVEYYEPVGNGRIRLIWNVLEDNSDEAQIVEAVKAAEKSDVAIVVAGIHEGEFQDRALLSLPGRQEELIARIAATGKPTVVVLVGGSAITMRSWISHVDAVIAIWYPGEEGGHAVADVLTGDHNPAGRLPVTFPVHEGQLPLVYNHKPTGRGDDYHNLTGLPLFPFGFGLSYTTFDYSDIRVDKSVMSEHDSATVSFKVKNIGVRAGDEVCQLYITDVLASVARPVMELKGFQRIHLQRGEEKILHFRVDRKLLSMFDKQLRETVESGEFRIMIGASSRDIRLETKLTIE